MPRPLYCYRAAITRIVDGDTLIADVDLGFHTWKKGVRIRLAGINTPELSGPGGIQARDHVVGLMPDVDKQSGHPVVIKSVKVDKYGNRWDAVVWLGKLCLNEELVKAGHATQMASATEMEELMSLDPRKGVILICVVDIVSKT